MLLPLASLLALLGPSIPAAGASSAQESAPPLRRVLTVEDGDAWRTIESTALSRSGLWAAYELRFADGRDGSAEIVATDASVRFEVERGTAPRIDAEDGFVALRRKPARDAVRAAKKEKVKDDEMPKGDLVLLRLPDGERVEIEGVEAFSLPEKGAGVVAYVLAPEKEAEEDGDEDSDEEPAEEAEEEASSEEGEEEEEEPEVPDHVKKKEDGRRLVLSAPFDDETPDRTFENVAHHAFSEDGRWLLIATSTKDAEVPDEVVLVDVAGEREPRVLSSGESRARSLVFSEDGASCAFLSDVGHFAEEQPVWLLLATATVDEGPARVVATAGTEGVPEGWGVSEHRTPRFSRSGGRLLFGTAPLPEPEPDELPEDEQVDVDVWSWTDPDLQPQQLIELEEEQKRSYLALARTGEESVVQIEDVDLPSVALADEGDAPFGHGVRDEPYRVSLQWNRWGLRDVVAVEARTGERRTLLEGVRGRFGASPDGRWLTRWDPDTEAWQVLDVESSGAELVDLTSSLRVDGESVVFSDERQDTPDLPRAYGSAGWLADSSAFLVYDAYDVWALDPTSPSSPRLVTAGEGRANGTRYRVLDDDPDEPGLSVERPLLLSGLDLTSKRASLAVVDENGLTTLFASDEVLGRPRRAAEGTRHVFTRETFRAFPDLWAADVVAGEDAGGAHAMTPAVRLTDANPQAREFAWGTARPHRWRSMAGEELEGILYLPEDHDPARPLPLLVYFYERNAENLHRHHAPIPHRSIVRFPTYTSKGYAVFVPDIVYREGAPGPSAFDCVVPGVLDLIERGIADPERIGVQGHSWGGYQIAYLVTRTDVFTCAISGAPVSNMTSAYGGIRWRTGLSRQFQYERTQSRIGGTLWERTSRYIENSPLFFADRVSTPLLILHNDGDGAVPWEQGIEFFVALRRLRQPVWLLNYAGEKHGLTKYAHMRDYARRMAAFNDHHLLGAPAPAWMTKGIPATRKGRDLGHGPAVVPAAPGPVRSGAAAAPPQTAAEPRRPSR
ncbi:MAG: prolyl oligopeptidase family serine peptidase [Planctomycetota bacterium]